MRDGARTATTAARTNAPPRSCPGPSDSPKTTKASATVTTGSSVDRIDAADGPTRRRPAKKSAIAPTVDTAARQVSQPRPASPTAPGWRSPAASDAIVNVAAAPVQTRAPSGTGPRREATPSELKMYVL